jgi:hypothetical protein
MSSQPVDAIELGAGLPAWLLRALIAAAAGTVVVLLAGLGVAGPALILLGVAALVSVGFPASPGPLLVVILVGLSLAALGASPFSARVLVLVPLVHLLHLSCAIASLVPIGARIHPRALRGPALRWLAIQAGTFGLVGVLAVTPNGWVSAPMELLVMAGLAATGVLLVVRLGRPSS